MPVLIADTAVASAVSASGVIHLATGLHVVPEFLGNRAPFADPHARAVISGLGMDRDFDSLVALYVAGLCGIGYGLRQIIEAQAKAGANVERVVISGGAGQHDLVRQVLADACGIPVVSTVSQEPVLLGSAILGAVASGAFANARSAMTGLCLVDRIYTPVEGPMAQIHAKRYAAFITFQEVARASREF